MYSVAECRKRAQDCVEQAQVARGPDKQRLLKFAQDWLTLADEQEKLHDKIGRGAPDMSSRAFERQA